MTQLSLRNVWLLTLLAPLTSAFAACSDGQRPTGSNPIDNGNASGGDSSSSLGGGGSNLGGADPSGGGPMIPSTSGVCEGVQCDPGRGCFEQNGSAVCDCLSGYSGPSCDDVNECSVPDRCGPGATCRNFPGTFACSCGPGTEPGSDGCVDIDECEDDTSACDSQAACSNTEGSHVCTCSPGLFGDGTFCKAEDDCAPNPCGAGTCRNTKTAFACSCPLGTKGATCQDSCAPDSPISFASSILEAAVRASAGIVGEITPNKLAGQTALYAPPPDASLATDDEIRSLDGLECWTTLETIDLPGHGVQDLEGLKHLARLTDVNLSCTEADDLSPLSNLPILRRLDLSKGALCTDNQRDTLSLAFASELSSLRELDLEAAGFVTSLAPLSTVKRLEKLNVRGSELPSLTGLDTLLQLVELDLAQNPISDVSEIADLPRLALLRLAGGDVEDLEDVSQVTSLVDLDLSHNAVSDISKLSSLTALQFLDLADNSITNIGALGAHQKLVVVDLTNNSIESLTPLAENSFFSAATLRLTGNALSCDEVATDLAIISARGVSVLSDCD